MSKHGFLHLLSSKALREQYHDCDNFELWKKEMMAGGKMDIVDFKKCQEDLIRLVPEAVDMRERFWEDFLLLGLPDVLTEERNMENSVKPVSEYRDIKSAIGDLSAMPQRLKNLKLLEKAFNTTVTEKLKTTTSFQVNQYSNSVREAVVEYYKTLGMSLDHLTNESGRNYSFTRSDDYLKCNLKAYLRNTPAIEDVPVSILSAINTEKRHLFWVIYEKDVDRCTFDCFWGHLPHSEERVFQIQFIQKLHDILQLTDEQRCFSWRMYLQRWDKRMLSAKEISLWREYLPQNQYKEVLEKEVPEKEVPEKEVPVPEIGFQLCFWDNLQNCLDIELETLHYDLVPHWRFSRNVTPGTGESEEKNFFDIYNKHCTEITSISKKIDKIMVKSGGKDPVNEYLEIWKDAAFRMEHDSESKLPDVYRKQLQRISRLAERSGVLKEVSCISPNIQMHREELNRLLAETVFRTIIVQRAKDVLWKWFSKTYFPSHQRYSLA